MILQEEYKIKNFDKAFDVMPYTTEWNFWCKHTVPFINAKFGNRPFLKPYDNHGWWKWDKKRVEDTVKNHSVIYLMYGSLDYHIKLLFDACQKINEPRIIVSDTNIQFTTPKNVKIISTAGLAYQFSRTFADTNVKPVYKRSVKNLKYPFMIMASSNDNGRPRLMLMLEKLGILKKSLYSSGHISPDKLLFPEDNLGINTVLTDIKKKIIGKEYIRFNVEKNFDIIPSFINQCHFYVATDTDGLYNHKINWTVSEKHLWGFTTTAPVISIWCDNTRQQMQKWGYRNHNISKRQNNETLQDTVERWCKEILFYYQITCDPNWSQSWQDKQKLDTAHNFELTRRLYKIISSDISRQIDELPVEFKNL